MASLLPAGREVAAFAEDLELLPSIFESLRAVVIGRPCLATCGQPPVQEWGAGYCRILCSVNRTMSCSCEPAPFMELQAPQSS